MRRSPALPLLLLVASLAAPGPAPAADARLELYGGARITVTLPEGWALDATRNEGGYVVARVTDDRRRVSLQLSFFPDANGRLAEEGAQARLVGEIVEPYLADSVEQEARLQPLGGPGAQGFYCVFTDAKLVGLKELPPDEYRHATVGVRVAAGWFAVFTLLSQDTSGEEHRAALRLLQLGLRPVAAPGRDPRAF